MESSAAWNVREIGAGRETLQLTESQADVRTKREKLVIQDTRLLGRTTHEERLIYGVCALADNDAAGEAIGPDGRVSKSISHRRDGPCDQAMLSQE